MLCLLAITLLGELGEMRNQALEIRRKSAQKYSQSSLLCCKGLSLDPWLVFELPSQSLTKLVYCHGSEQATARCALGQWGQLQVGLRRVWCIAPFPFCHLSHFGKSCHLTVPQISLTYKTRALTSIKGTWELIKTYSGMRLMPIVQGIVETLSSVRFSHPSRRWITANWNRCRGRAIRRRPWKDYGWEDSLS